MGEGGGAICASQYKEEKNLLTKNVYRVGGGVLEMPKSACRTFRTLP